MRRRTDEFDDAALDIRQTKRLLRFVKALNFVNEQDRGSASVFKAIRWPRPRRGACRRRSILRRSNVRICSWSGGR